MQNVGEEIPGYSYGKAEVGPSHLSLADLERLKISTRFTELDWQSLLLAGEVLADQTEKIVAHWRSGIIASIPHLARHSRTPEGDPLPEYLAKSNLRFQQWIVDTCTKPYDQDWLNYQEEIALRHTASEKEPDRRSAFNALCTAERYCCLRCSDERNHQALPRLQGPRARRCRTDAFGMVQVDAVADGALGPAVYGCQQHFERGGNTQGREDVKKLIWLIYKGFVFERKCIPGLAGTGPRIRRLRSAWYGLAKIHYRLIATGLFRGDGVTSVSSGCVAGNPGALQSG
jgi:hypothetical protein